MSLENKFKELGFVNFINLDKNKRDSFLRLTWSGIYKNNILTILILNRNGIWEIEKILFNLKDKKINKIVKHNNITELIIFLESLKR